MRPTRVGDGVMTVAFPWERFDFRDEVGRLLVAKGIVGEVGPLETLHHQIAEADRRVDEHLMNNVTKAFYETSLRFWKFYTGLLQWLGHSTAEINCWLPVTHCYGSNTLWLAPLDASVKIIDRFYEKIGHDVDAYHRGFDAFRHALTSDIELQRDLLAACRPVELRYGEMVIFDTRCLHTPAENKEAETRISFDFRLIEVGDYAGLRREYVSAGRSGRKFTRGDVFFAKTIRELAAS